jgi:hypothetical protein
MKKHKKMKNVVYIALLAVFLIVVGIRTFQNISLIQKITQNPGIEDASVESNLLIFKSEGCSCSGKACGGCAGDCSGSCPSGQICQGGAGSYHCVVSCSCGAWANAGCAAGGCVVGNMSQTRTCSPSGCDLETQCVADTCGAWTNAGCGLGTCPAGQMNQTRTCTFGCLPTSQCVDDASCCVRTAPTVSIVPSSQTTYPTGILTYTVNVTNPDTSGCTSSTFGLSNTCPSGWTCQLSKSSVTISPGATDSSATITITSPASASEASYPFSVAAQNQASGLSGSGSGTYVVNLNSGCDGHSANGFCNGTETQITCPGDCKTTATMSPNANLIVGQPAQVTIFFSDGRYLANHNVKFNLVIEGIVWDFNNYCQYGGVVLSKDAAGGTTKWSGASIASTSQDYNFTTTFTCKVPIGLNQGAHTLLVTPIIYSQSMTLRAVQVQFTVAGNQSDFSSYITSFINAVKSFLGIK